MKYIKMLGLLAVAATALMAFAGTAAATTLTSPANQVYTSTIEASAGSTSLHNTSLEQTVTCKSSSVKGTVEQHGESVTAGGAVSTLHFNECGDDTVTVVNKGSLLIHSNGEVTSTGAEITIKEGSTGIACTYKTSGTKIGTFTESSTTGGTAVLDIASSTIPREGDSIFCGTKGQWTGTYTVTNPDFLDLD
ncbi:MAG TPA: hypothetical protein VFT79_13755 [Solirubrobacterales bacterium]|nr:hypothetical protein [Solirubrobacterales bacterium]